MPRNIVQFFLFVVRFVAFSLPLLDGSLAAKPYQSAIFSDFHLFFSLIDTKKESDDSIALLPGISLKWVLYGISSLGNSL